MIKPEERRAWLRNHPDILPLLGRIDGLRQEHRRMMIAIDGRSAAGKSTLARLLQSVYNCNVLPMDDFFLQPFQRTPERLAQPGGHVDHERFFSQVLEPLRAGISFSYRPYDCAAGELAGEKVVLPRALNIVEGVYGLHPNLIAAYDLKIFLDVSPAEQRRRLRQRSPRLYERFVREWLPMEEAYFDAFHIRSLCDFVLRLTEQGEPR